jgi:hypothetical protein
MDVSPDRDLCKEDRRAALVDADGSPDRGKMQLYGSPLMY